MHSAKRADKFCLTQVRIKDFIINLGSACYPIIYPCDQVRRDSVCYVTEDHLFELI